MKKCVYCFDVKPETAFNTYKTATDGLRSICRDCQAKRGKAHNGRPVPPEGKKCASCSEWKVFTMFHKDRSRPDGHKEDCRKCRILGADLVAHKTKQRKLKGRYDDGDTKIDLCDCGDYYLNEKHEKGKGWLIFNECEECRVISKEDQKLHSGNRRLH